jgi:hypothetical protein
MGYAFTFRAVGRGDPAQRASDSFLRTGDSEPDATAGRDCHVDAQVCRCRFWNEGREFWTPARPRPACACSTNMRCAAAAGKTTGSILSDGVLIKNNHIALAGGVVPVLERAIRNRRGEQIIEIEVRSLDELEQALTHGAEALLLDNMSVEDVKRDRSSVAAKKWNGAFHWKFPAA